MIHSEVEASVIARLARIWDAPRRSGAGLPEIDAIDLANDISSHEKLRSDANTTRSAIFDIIDWLTVEGILRRWPAVSLSDHNRLHRYTITRDPRETTKAETTE